MNKKALAIQLGSRIRQARLYRGLKQKNLARIIGKNTHQEVSYWENGDRLPNVCDLIAIAKTLNVSTDYLLSISPGAESPVYSPDLVREHFGLSRSEELTLKTVLCKICERMEGEEE